MVFPLVAQGASAVLAWDAPTGTVTGYNLYRSTTSGAFTTKLNATQPTTGQMGGETYLPGKLQTPKQVSVKVHCSFANAKVPPLSAAVTTT